jgi:hypothetical protein
VAYPHDALLDMVGSIWQMVIGGLVVVVMLVAAIRLSRRGPSRMSTALIITGVAVLGIVALGLIAAYGSAALEPLP